MDKLEARPVNLKTPRPASKLGTGQQNKDIKTLKRAGEVWKREDLNGPSKISPSGQVKTNYFTYGGGSGSGRPPDPVTTKTLEEDLYRKGSEAHLRTG